MATMKTVFSLLFTALLLAPLAVPHTCNEHSIGEGATRGRCGFLICSTATDPSYPYTINSFTTQLNGKSQICVKNSRCIYRSRPQRMETCQVHHLCLNCH
ncbi:unnamed protein product [Urochloa humidicola]